MIVNEAISNTLRHAEAEHLKIETQQVEGKFIITIADDGKGFDVKLVSPQSGLGLPNISQRARFYDGQVTIDSAPGKGTTLTISIPVRP